MQQNASFNKAAPTYDVICFSHLRWDFVYQRPQHLMSRFGKDRRVFYIEEPIFDGFKAHWDISERETGVFVCVPHLARETKADSIDFMMLYLVNLLIAEKEVEDYIFWVYTPMMLPWRKGLKPKAVVYDCMDQLSAFKNAPNVLHIREAELFDLADLVFTGGHSLFEAKRNHHDAVYAFPSSIDTKHFGRALDFSEEMDDQRETPHPRIGFIGVIDERMDVDLLARIAELKPAWHFIMIGPVVKIDEADLPRAGNIHYLGGKQYGELPGYIAGWDAAMMPFAINESTEFISPTKTPEYLAAGQPVVSTAIRDVVRPYGEMGLVHIAETAEEFVAKLEIAMSEDEKGRREKAAEFLSDISWDKTFNAMLDLIGDAIEERVGKNESVKMLSARF
ncbi:MAG: glycosyltransferase [Pyrinomonadaceae bacterium]